MYIYFSAAVALIAAIVYLVSHNAKVEHMALITFGAGMLAFLVRFAH